MNPSIRRVTWWLLVSGMLATAGVVTATPPRAACAKFAGRVDGLMAGGQRPSGPLTQLQMKTVRGPQLLAGQNGLPICYGDLISTAADVTAVLRLGPDAGVEQFVTIGPDTTIELLDQSSLWLKRGRAYVALRSRFELRTIFGNLTTRSADMQVAVDDTFHMVLVAGNVELAPPAAGGPWTTMQLGPHSQVAIERGKPVVLPAGRERCETIVNANTDMILATRPPDATTSLIRTYGNDAERALIYRKATFDAVWAPTRDAYDGLGSVFGDWGDAPAAIRAFGQADLLGPMPTSGRLGLLTLDMRAKAQRLAGNLDVAERIYKQSIDLDPSSALPYNGLGDVFRDRALAAFDRGLLPAALEFAGLAHDTYTKALSRDQWGKDMGPSRAVGLANLADTLRMLGEWNMTQPKQTDFSTAAKYFQAAESRFAEVVTSGRELGFSEPLFSRIGAARLSAARARMYGLQRKSDLAAEAFTSAQTTLETLLREHPDFAVAHEVLGEVLAQAGRNDQALPHFSRAVELDTGYALAYYQYAKTLTDLRRTEDARMYFKMYLTLETPLYRSGDRVRRATAGL